MARSFNGTSDKIVYSHIPVFDGINKFSLSTWAKVETGGSDYGTAIGQTGANGTGSGYASGFALFNNVGFEHIPCFAARNNDDTNFDVSPDNTWIASSWVHTYVVYDGTQASGSRVRMWISGSEITFQSHQGSANPTTIGTCDQTFKLGVDGPGSAFWQGALAEIGIWSDAITDGTRISNLASGQAPSFFTTSLHIYLPLLQAGGADDVQGNAGSPTITGTTAVAHPSGITYPSAGDQRTDGRLVIRQS